jgi:hypothetical protein
MEGQLVVSAAVVALFLLEGTKWLFRKFIYKTPNFEFAPIFYELLIPFLTAAVGLGFGYAGLGPDVALEPMALVNWGLAVVLELALYHMGVQPFKAYVRGRTEA